MSVINKMLQDLDRRQALGAASDPALVRPQGARAGGHEWFWRILVVLLAVALAWMGWVAWQLMPPKPLATELAFQAAAQARSRAAAKPAAPATAPVPSVAPAPAPAEPLAAQNARSEPLKLALQLETPVKEREPEAAKPEPAPEPAMGGTNNKGFILGAQYGLSKNTSVSVRWMSSNEITGLPLSIDVFQLYFNARF